MSGLAYCAAVVLAAALAWAATTKATAASRTVRAFAALGVPLPKAAAVAVPVVEIAVAALLVLLPQVGGVAALLLLAVFSLFVASRLRRGVTVSCSCFGAARREPLSAVALLRNGLLATLAVAALFAAPAVPSLEAVIAASTAISVGSVVLALAHLRQRTGPLLAISALAALEDGR